MTSLSYLIAQTTAPASQPAGGPPGILQGPMVPLLIGIAVLYFFVFRAKRKQDKQRRDMMDLVKPGQRIQTIGGIIGVITQVNEKEVTVKVDETNNVKIKFSRSAIHRVFEDEKAAEKSETK